MDEDFDFESISKQVISFLIFIPFTLLLIFIAWYIMWKLFLSKFTFLRELIFPDGDGRAADPEKKAELRKKRELRKRRE